MERREEPMTPDDPGTETTERAVRIQTSAFEMDAKPHGSNRAPGVRRISRLGSIAASCSLLVIWAVLIIIFGIIEPSTFLTLATLRTVMAEQAITAIMALALLMPIAANTFDLSIGGAMGVGIVFVAVFLSDLHLNPILAIALTLAIGLLIGAVNSFVVIRLRVSSFIATLAAGTILDAIQQWPNGGNQIVSGIPASFTDAGQKSLLTIPLPFFFMLIVAAVLWYTLKYRQVGRYLYATGSNADAARLAGVRTDRLMVVALLVSAVVATLAGIIFVMRIGASSVDSGDSYLLPAFAAAFLGATQFREGKVNVPGTLLAVYVLATGVTGLQLMGAPFWVADLFNGCALIIAVALAVRAGHQRLLG
jgi:ribose transport system permease protein